MEPLKRQIGYIKPKTQPQQPAVVKNYLIEKATPFVESASKSLLKMQSMIGAENYRTQKIVTWIKDHPYFKWGAMCGKLKIDKGNFQRTLKADTPNIKSDVIQKIEEILSSYGYGK